MLFNDSIKQHWIEKINELGDRFNPDCGSSEPSWDLGDAAPLNLLSGKYGKRKYEEFSKEFQLPIWIIQCIQTHMHEVSPRTSKDDLLKLFNACPTYVDLELLKFKFMQKICLYLIDHFSDIKAELSDAYYGSVWANLLAVQKLKYNRTNIDDLIDGLIKKASEEELKFEYWGFNSKYSCFGHSYESILNGWTDCVDYINALHELRGDSVDRAECGWVVYKMLINTLEGK